MYEQTQQLSSPPDMALLLRVYGEQRWLLLEVFPVLREAERPDAIDDHDLPAALAYLEILWSQARRLASETDAAAEQLDGSGLLADKARRYHAAVRRMRSAMCARVERVTLPFGPPLPQEPAGL